MFLIQNYVYIGDESGQKMKITKNFLLDLYSDLWGSVVQMSKSQNFAAETEFFHTTKNVSSTKLHT